VFVVELWVVTVVVVVVARRRFLLDQTALRNHWVDRPLALG